MIERKWFSYIDGHMLWLRQTISITTNPCNRDSKSMTFGIAASTEWVEI